MTPKRSDTPLPYSSDEASAIRAAFARREGTVSCPRCGEDLIVGAPVGGGGTVPPVHELRCARCRCSVIAAAGH